MNNKKQSTGLFINLSGTTESKAQKKNTKIGTLLILLGLLLLGGNRVQAQQPKGPQPREQALPSQEQIKERVDKLAQELSLSEAQRQQIEKLYLKHISEVKEKTEKGQPNPQEMRDLKRALDKEVKTLLSDEQKKEFDIFQMQDRGPQRQPPVDKKGATK